MSDVSIRGKGLVWAGAAAAIIGWCVLLFGVGRDTPLGMVANLHTVAIAQSLIISGLLVVLIGIVKGGVDVLPRNLPTSVQSGSAVSAESGMAATDQNGSAKVAATSENIDLRRLSDRIEAARAKLK